ncbi:carbohydrate ABC transporter permease [Actinomadura rupiterrae]|uniref:carbohydrate ABC transporter permease n=1 Tax=Actinomadura rupiterrae TaxID=559627 RepID=UPI0020A48572|nr:carbohydrate ABC transporter permease [Actinomadura rupiterrae]MCP2341737.1 multiple sugar transport system permease protein [Actinomadura rupiterrae]
MSTVTAPGRDTGAAPSVRDAPPRTRRARGERLRRTAIYAALSLGLGLVVTPFAWTLLSSFKPEHEIRQSPPTFLPAHPTLAGYREMLASLHLGTTFTNSVLVAAAQVSANLLLCSMAGYALAKLPFPGRRAVFGLVMAQMMVPGIVLVIPQFVVVTRLGLTDTLLGVVLPYLVWPLGVFLMRQFIAEIPDELLQAARIDGAGEFRIFFRIVLPLCRPALATLTLLSFLNAWNNFLWPAIVAQTQDRYTLPVALALFSNEETTHYGLLLAGAVVVITPIVVLFLCLQRFFIEGIASTGIK